MMNIEEVNTDLKIISEDTGGSQSAHSNFGPPEETLVEFDPPQLFVKPSDRRLYSNHPHHVICTSNCGSSKTPLDVMGTEELSQLLDTIRSPQEWIDDADNLHYIRHISRDSAPESKSVELDHRLENLLKQRRSGRSGGLCPIRRQLFDDCFDEIIRQVTINNPERGMILIRCRDELRATRTTYWELFVSSECYVSRKCARVTSSNAKLAKSVQVLKVDIENVKLMLVQLQQSLRANAIKHAEDTEKLDKKHNEELEFIKITSGRLKAQSEKFATPSRGLRENMQRSQIALKKASQAAVAKSSK